jgi:hypothetical protein
MKKQRRHKHKLPIYLLMCRRFPSLKYYFKLEQNIQMQIVQTGDLTLDQEEFNSLQKFQLHSNKIRKIIHIGRKYDHQGV